MAETVQITLTAKDGTTQVFKTTGAAAERMGQQAEDAGKRGSRSLSDWAKAGQRAGLALGALGTIAVRAANESEQVQRRLQQSIENTGESYDDLADKIDRMADQALDLAFDDEDALGALASLTDATGNATTALSDMSLVMDLARARSIGLAEAAKIVAAVEQGRFGPLARMGIVIEENATREEALAQLQAKYAGQAAIYAETNAATWDRMGNTIENRLEGIGGALANVQGPLIALGAASQLGLGGLVSGLFGGGGAIAGVAGLTAAAAPLVVTMGALAVPIGIATYLIADQDNVMRRAAEATAENNEQLQKYIAWLNQVAETDVDPLDFQGTEADRLLDFFRDVNQEVLLTRDGIHGVTIPMSDLRDSINRLSPENFDRIVTGAEQLGIVFSDPSTWSPEALNALAQQITALDSQQNDAAMTALENSRAQNRMASATDESTASVDRLNRAEAGQIATSRASTEARYAEADAIRLATDEEKRRAVVTDEAIARTTAHMVAMERENAAREAAAATALAQGQAVLAATQSYAGMVGTTNALDSGISVVIGGLDNLGAGVEKVDGSLRELVGAAGEWGEIDQLLADGRISWNQYNAAIKAADDTTTNNYTTQQDLNAILANQAPLLADLAWQQQQYVAGLADLPADQQLLALAYMDSAEAGKALELQTLAISAANGELGEGGKGFAKDIIRGAAEADPILKAMLVDMGLITVGAEGTIKVNFGEGTSELDALNTTLQQLQGAIEVIVNVDLNDDGIVGYVPPEKEMKVKPVVEEGADAPTFDPITWPVDLKINENAPPTFDPITVAVEPEWPQYTIQPVTPPAIKVEYEYETFDPPELTNYTATIDVEAAAANEAIGDAERRLDTIDTTTATATVDLDTGPFDTAYSTVTADVATLDALSASVSVSLTSTVAGKVQDITTDVETIDALAATVDFKADREAYNTVRNEVSSDVNLAMAWSATVDFKADREAYNTVRNEVSSDVNLAMAWSATVDFNGDASGFNGVRDGVSSSVGVVEGWSATVDILADASGYYNNLPVTGQTIGTNYINVERRTVGGGAPEPYATGGVVIRAAEAGPEMVTSPSGMRAILPSDGLYNVREGSYVSPAAATRGQMGGGGGTANSFAGATIYVVASTPDIHDALNGQLLAQGRR